MVCSLNEVMWKPRLSTTIMANCCGTTGAISEFLSSNLKSHDCRLTMLRYLTTSRDREVCSMRVVGRFATFVTSYRWVANVLRANKFWFVLNVPPIILIDVEVLALEVAISSKFYLDLYQPANQGHISLGYSFTWVHVTVVVPGRPSVNWSNT